MFKSLQQISLIFLFALACSAQSNDCFSVQQKTNTYTTSRQYTLACDSDIPYVGDIGNVGANTMVDCMKACDSTSTCNVVMYWRASKTCYMKSITANQLKQATNTGADLAYLSSLAGTNGPSTTTSSSSSTATPSSNKYTIAKNSDVIPGYGDLGNTGAQSITDCMQACDATPLCTAAVYWDNYKTCYMKSVMARDIRVQQSGGDLIYLTAMTTCSALRAKGQRIEMLGSQDYTIQCGADAWGQGEIKNMPAGSILECLVQCDGTQGCNAVAFWQSTKTCYLKGISKSASIASSDGADFAALTSLGVAGTAYSYDQTGAWKTAGINFPVVPVAAAVVPNSNKVFVWSAASVDSVTTNDANRKYTAFATWDSGSGSVSQQTISNTNHDMFCPGISSDVQGRLIVTGGSTSNAVSIYNPKTGSWSAAAGLQIPRGYQSSALTSDGKVFTIGGSWNGGNGGKNGEIYNPNTNTWTKLPGCAVEPILTNDAKGVYRQDNHAWLFGWKNGYIFHAGPSKAMNWFSTSGSGSYKTVGNRGNAADAMSGNAVMYDANAGKILTLGGSPNYDYSVGSPLAHIITLGDPLTTPYVEQAGNLTYQRTLHNSVVAPNGEVYVFGGQYLSTLFTDYQATNYPEVFSPSTKQFRILEALPAATGRTYHSVALLLPDATIFSAGGGLCGGNCQWNHFDGEIYQPPYLFAKNSNTLATRPKITSVSTTTFYAGTKFTVRITSSSAVTFSLIRTGGVTHSTNTDQRRIPLTNVSGSGSSYTLTLPSDYGVLPAGWYYLFATDGNGVPSVASWVQVLLR